MADEFKGNPAPLGDSDFEAAARSIGCTVAAVRAVAQVESAGGGFLIDGRPKILFERHVFHRQTGGRFSERHSHVSWPGGGGYVGGPAEYDRLAEAISLDREAALKSASWGKFQIMGFNHAIVGHADVEGFVRAMVSGEPAQLRAFVQFIKSNGLDDELIRLDWAGFARGYNGPGYRAFRYDEKMRDAYNIFRQGGARTENPAAPLSMGDRGPAVSHLQELLGIKVDGDFGPATKAAVIAFQSREGLYADGIVGARTWSRLLPVGPAPGSTPTAGAVAPVRVAPEDARPPLRQGDKGADVAFLQQKLGLAADGIFGSNTRSAAVEFQKRMKLTPDGLVGRMTWRKLLGG